MNQIRSHFELFGLLVGFVFENLPEPENRGGRGGRLQAGDPGETDRRVVLGKLPRKEGCMQATSRRSWVYAFGF